MQWLMLQQETPDDYVIATGRQFSVRAFVDAAALELGITLRWEGQGLAEKGVVESVNMDKLNAIAAPHTIRCHVKPGDSIVDVDPRYFRPAEVETLLGNPAKAAEQLGWRPTISFEEMVSEMAREDLILAMRDSMITDGGFKSYTHHE